MRCLKNKTVHPLSGEHVCPSECIPIRAPACDVSASQRPNRIAFSAGSTGPRFTYRAFNGHPSIVSPTDKFLVQQRVIQSEWEVLIPLIN